MTGAKNAFEVYAGLEVLYLTKVELTLLDRLAYDAIGRILIRCVHDYFPHLQPLLHHPEIVLYCFILANVEVKRRLLKSYVLAGDDIAAGSQRELIVSRSIGNRTIGGSSHEDCSKGKRRAL